MDAMNKNNSTIKRHYTNDKNNTNFRSLIIENDKYKFLNSSNKNECFMGAKDKILKKLNNKRNKCIIKSDINLNRNKKVCKIKKLKKSDNFNIINSSINKTTNNIINNNLNNYTKLKINNNNSKDKIFYINNYYSSNNSISTSNKDKFIKFNFHTLKEKFPTLENDEKRDLMNCKIKKIYYLQNNNELSNQSDLYNGMTRINPELIKKIKRDKKNISCNINKSVNNLNNLISLKIKNEQKSIQKEKNNHKIYKIRKVEYNNCQNISNLKNNLHLNDIKSELELNGRSEVSTNYCSTSTSEIYPKLKYKRKIKNNKMKELNFLKNKKKTILLLEMEKQKIMDENFKNYQKYLSLIQKQKKEFDEYDKYLKKGLDDTQGTEKKNEAIKNKPKKKGTKSYFNFLKNQKLSNSLQNIKKENKLSNNNLLNYNESTLINKSIQKYFMINENYSENKVSKNKKNNANRNLENKSLDNNINSKEKNKINKSSKKQQIKLNINVIQKFKKLKLKNKKKEDNNHKHEKFIKRRILTNISAFSDNNTKKRLKMIKEGKNFEKEFILNKKKNIDSYFHRNKFEMNNQIIHDEIDKRLILKKIRKKNNENSEKDIKINLRNLSKNIKASNSYNILETKSLKKLHELDDYIGPNQYNDVFIPDNNRKVMRMISEEKERTLNKIKNAFKFNEMRRNHEYYSQTKKREIKDMDDYYQKKDFDKLTLSSEKKSKYFNLKDKLYYAAFKPCKYEGTIKTESEY